MLKLAVREMPRSGKPEELLNAYGIDAEHIADGRASARRLGSHHLVEPPLPLARGAEHVCLVGARLDHRTQRRRSSASRPSRSSTTTAAPRSDASLTPDVVTGRPSASAMICTQSGSLSSAPPVATISSIPAAGRRSRQSERQHPRGRPGAGRAAWCRTSARATAPFACWCQPGLRSPPRSDRNVSPCESGPGRQASRSHPSRSGSARSGGCRRPTASRPRRPAPRRPSAGRALDEAAVGPSRRPTRIAPDVPTISAARSRVTQPAPRLEQAPSSSAGYQPSTGASEISGRRSASRPSVSSSSSSHVAASRGRPVPSRKQSRCPWGPPVRAAARRGSRRTRRSGARSERRPALPAPATPASPASSSCGSDSRCVHARPRCRDGGAAGRRRRQNACRASREPASAAVPAPSRASRLCPNDEDPAASYALGARRLLDHLAHELDEPVRDRSHPRSHAARASPTSAAVPSKSCARTEDVPTSSARNDRRGHDPTITRSFGGTEPTSL